MIVIAGYLIAMVVVTLIRGVTIDQFWSWFITDPGAPFHGSLPTLTLGQALGLSLIVGVFVVSTIGADADEAATQGESAGEKLLMLTIRATLIYGFFWIFAIVVKGLM